VGELARASKALERLYTLDSAVDFPKRAIDTILALVPSEIGSMHAIDVARGTSVNWLLPREQDTTELWELWARSFTSHPVLVHYEKTRDPRPLMTSALMTKRQFVQTPFYIDFYRQIRMQDCLGMTIVKGKRELFTFGLVRSGWGFSQRERAMLDFMRSHVAVALANSRVVDGLGERCIWIDHDTNVTLASESTRSTLARALGLRAWSERALPDGVQRWVRDALARLRPGSELGPPPTPLRIGTLELRLSLREDGACIKVLEPAATPSPYSHGLSPREAEVLAWAARGKTNWEIATILSVRRRTVATHLERIYAKLDVTSRSAAVARVFGRPLSAI